MTWEFDGITPEEEVDGLTEQELIEYKRVSAICGPDGFENPDISDEEYKVAFLKRVDLLIKSGRVVNQSISEELSNGILRPRGLILASPADAFTGPTADGI